MERLFSALLDEVAHDLAWSSDGGLLAAASLDGWVHVFAAATGERIASERAHAGGALSLAFSPRGDWLVSGGMDGSVRLFDVRAGASPSRLLPGPAKSADGDRGGEGWVSRCVFSADGETLACAVGRQVRFYSSDGDLVGEPVTHASTVSDLLHHETLGFMASSYGGVSFLEPGASRPRNRLDYRGSILVLRASDDGRFVAAGNQDSTIRFWDLISGEDANLTGYPAKVRKLSWSSDGVLLASGAGSHIVLWSCLSGCPVGTRPLTLDGQRARITGLTFELGDTRLLSASEDGTLVRHRLEPELPVEVVDDVECGAPIRRLRLHRAKGTVAVSTLDGRIEAFTVDPS